MKQSNHKNATTQNEPIKKYLFGSKNRKLLLQTILELQNSNTEIPLVINGEDVKTETTISISAPHNHQLPIALANVASPNHVNQAIDAALEAKKNWKETNFEDRADIFLKAANIITGKKRELMNAATMLGQGKNIYQAEIDCVCELADFLRFNIDFARDIFKIQPASSPGITNTLQYRPLEGFVVAITPFNFTAIAGNLCCAPALMGNTIIWKPSEQQLYSAHFLMKILMEAGLPPGVINMVYADGPEFGEVCFNHKYFAGLHFTGSSKVFDHLWLTIAKNLSKYKSYPKIVGETGGKDFILAHHSANLNALSTAIIRGAFEYQGQKCSAASRAYIPRSIWDSLHVLLVEECNKITVDSPEKFTFMNAVISKSSFDKTMTYISNAKQSLNAEIIFGGSGDDSTGYFIQPTIILAKTSDYESMCEEIFGPVITIFVYEDNDFESTIQLVDSTSIYALTGSIFATDEQIIKRVSNELDFAAGNFYINDKPSGAVVNQQPFGGARKSGTNDKAGSLINLLQWVSPRTIKENHSPPESFEYPFMKKE